MPPRSERKDNRGGKRTPAKPAPVSGSGENSARTDGKFGKNPSNAEQARQPVRPIPAESHGDRQAMTQLQQSAPMAAAPLPQGVAPAPTVGGNGGPNPNAPTSMDLPFDPFINTGQPSLDDMPDDEIVMDDVDMYMAQLARISNHPDLINLITQRGVRGGF